jgi:hypothetical protein
MKLHSYLRDLNKSNPDLQPLFGEKRSVQHSKSSMSMMAEGGEISHKNKSIVNES